MNSNARLAGLKDDLRLAKEHLRNMTDNLKWARLSGTVEQFHKAIDSRNMAEKDVIDLEDMIEDM